LGRLGGGGFEKGAWLGSAPAILKGSAYSGVVFCWGGGGPGAFCSYGGEAHTYMGVGSETAGELDKTKHAAWLGKGYYKTSKKGGGGKNTRGKTFAQQGRHLGLRLEKKKKKKEGGERRPAAGDKNKKGREVLASGNRTPRGFPLGQGGSRKSKRIRKRLEN